MDEYWSHKTNNYLGTHGRQAVFFCFRGFKPSQTQLFGLLDVSFMLTVASILGSLGGIVLKKSKLYFATTLSSSFTSALGRRDAIWRLVVYFTSAGTLHPLLQKLQLAKDLEWPSYDVELIKKEISEHYHDESNIFKRYFFALQVMLYDSKLDSLITSYGGVAYSIDYERTKVQGLFSIAQMFFIYSVTNVISSLIKYFFRDLSFRLIVLFYRVMRDLILQEFLPNLFIDFSNKSTLLKEGPSEYSRLITCEILAAIYIPVFVYGMTKIFLNTKGKIDSIINSSINFIANLFIKISLVYTAITFFVYIQDSHLYLLNNIWFSTDLAAYLVLLYMFKGSVTETLLEMRSIMPLINLYPKIISNFITVLIAAMLAGFVAGVNASIFICFPVIGYMWAKSKAAYVAETYFEGNLKKNKETLVRMLFGEDNRETQFEMAFVDILNGFIIDKHINEMKSEWVKQQNRFYIFTIMPVAISLGSFAVLPSVPAAIIFGFTILSLKGIKKIRERILASNFDKSVKEFRENQSLFATLLSSFNPQKVKSLREDEKSILTQKSIAFVDFFLQTLSSKEVNLYAKELQIFSIQSLQVPYMLFYGTVSSITGFLYKEIYKNTLNRTGKLLVRFFALSWLTIFIQNKETQASNENAGWMTLDYLSLLFINLPISSLVGSFFELTSLRLMFPSAKGVIVEESWLERLEKLRTKSSAKPETVKGEVRISSRAGLLLTNLSCRGGVPAPAPAPAPALSCSTPSSVSATTTSCSASAPSFKKRK